jgi:hypothetical protein
LERDVAGRDFEKVDQIVQLIDDLLPEIEAICENGNSVLKVWAFEEVEPPKDINKLIAEIHQEPLDEAVRLLTRESHIHFLKVPNQMRDCLAKARSKLKNFDRSALTAFDEVINKDYTRVDLMRVWGDLRTSVVGYSGRFLGLRRINQHLQACKEACGPSIELWYAEIVSTAEMAARWSGWTEAQRTQWLSDRLHHVIKCSAENDTFKNDFYNYEMRRIQAQIRLLPTREMLNKAWPRFKDICDIMNRTVDGEHVRPSD